MSAQRAGEVHVIDTVRCSRCDAAHHLPDPLTIPHPLPYNRIRKPQRWHESDDGARVLDGNRYFVRARLQLRLRDAPDSLRLVLWAELTARDFRELRFVSGLFHSAGPQIFAPLAAFVGAHVPGYADTSPIACRLHPPREDGPPLMDDLKAMPRPKPRPEEPHLLADDYQHGVPRHRLQLLIGELYHALDVCEEPSARFDCDERP